MQADFTGEPDRSPALEPERLRAAHQLTAEAPFPRRRGMPG